MSVKTNQVDHSYLGVILVASDIYAHMSINAVEALSTGNVNQLSDTILSNGRDVVIILYY